jgi:MFS family permease
VTDTTTEGTAAAETPAIDAATAVGEPISDVEELAGPAAIAGAGGRTRPASAGSAGMFAALRIYNYRLFFLGQGTSVAGGWMQNIAISWVVLQVTHSGVALGAVTAARFVPLLVLGPLGGLITDRSDKRRLLFVTQTCAALLSLILAVLSWTGHVSLPALILIVVGLGLVNVFDGPARQSLISNMVGRDRIANAIALNSIAMNTSRIVGPGVGGVIIATVGITPCFFVNAASFGAVIVSLLAMRRSELIPSEREVRSKGQVRAGLRYVAGTPALLAPLVMVTVAGTFAWEFPVTLPLMTSSTFHSDAAVYGTIMSCLGAGSIVGGLFAARRRHLSVRSLAISATIWGVLIAAAAAAPTLPVEYAVIVLVGAGAVTFNSAAKTLLQLESAPQMRGRVMSLWSMAWQGSTVIGAPIVGAVAALSGARFGLLVGGAATLMVGVFYVAVGRRHS